MPLAIKPKNVLHEVLRVNLETFSEQFNAFKVDKNSFAYSFLRRP